MGKPNLLLVDGDVRTRRVLEVSLRKAGFLVATGDDGEEAWSKVTAAPPDLIISDTQLPSVDGFAFCARVKQDQTLSQIPFIFLTKQRSIEDKIRGLELGVEEYLTKPIFVKEIVVRIKMLLQRHQRENLAGRDGRTTFSGDLSDMAVVDLIQTLELGAKSGIIHFRNDRGRQGAAFFRDGKLIDAELGRLQGERAVYRLLIWNEGNFDVEFRTIRRKDAIGQSNQSLLMEGMRRVDEWGRLLEQLPPIETVFEVDYDELAQRLGEIPDEMNAVIRLFDGRRSLLSVVDDSTMGDLEALEVISKLFFEGLIHETAAAAKPDRDTMRLWSQQREAAERGDPSGEEKQRAEAFASAISAEARDEPHEETPHRTTAPLPSAGVARQTVETIASGEEASDRLEGVPATGAVAAEPPAQLARVALRKQAAEPPASASLELKSAAPLLPAEPVLPPDPPPPAAVAPAPPPEPLLPAEPVLPLDPPVAPAPPAERAAAEQPAAEPSAAEPPAAEAVESPESTAEPAPPAPPPLPIEPPASTLMKRPLEADKPSAEGGNGQSDREAVIDEWLADEDAVEAGDAEGGAVIPFPKGASNQVDAAAEQAAARQGGIDPNAASIDASDEAFFASDYEPDPFEDEFVHKTASRGKQVFLAMMAVLLVGGGGVIYWAKTSPYVGRGAKHLQIKNRVRQPLKVEQAVDAAVAAKKPDAAVAARRPADAAKTPAAADATVVAKPVAADTGVAGATDEYTRLVDEAKALRAKKKRRKAVALFKKALAVNPHGWEALEAVAVVEALDRGRMSKGLKLAKEALSGNANAPRAHLVVGTVAAEKGDKAAAKAAFERYLQLCPDCHHANDIRQYVKSL